MRKFYEACEKASLAKKPETILKYLDEARDAIQPQLALARSRLELRTVADLVEYLRWTVAWCMYHAGQGKDPGIDPLWFISGGTTYVYPPAPKGNSSSLDYRWSKWQDRAESYLPWVGANKYGPYRGYMRYETA